jgi:hypothetical protein
MEIPVRYAMPEHETIRRLLEDVVCCAAAAETAPYPEHAELARAVAAVKRALHRHAMQEGHAGRALDALHDAEDAVAVELRCALGLEDVLAQVGRLAHLLAEEEVALGRLGREQRAES